MSFHKKSRVPGTSAIQRRPARLAMADTNLFSWMAPDLRPDFQGGSSKDTGMAGGDRRHLIPVYHIFCVMVGCVICYKCIPENTRGAVINKLKHKLASVGHFVSGSSNRDFYPVTAPQGFCIVININKYGVVKEGLEEERHGSQLDVEQVKFLFEKLHFIVEVREDLTAEGIDNYLSEVKQYLELAKHGSFVCFLMAHGDEDCIFGSDGNHCQISNLTAKFQSNVCRNLAGKPKIFFIQACRGQGKDAFITAVDSTPGAPELGSATFYPAKGDFLLCYATTEGQVSHRDKEFGSFFVQTLCKFIEEHYKNEHLEDIVKLVNRHMMNNPLREGTQILRRVSQTVGQLAYKVSFDPSRAQKSWGRQS